MTTKKPLFKLPLLGALDNCFNGTMPIPAQLPVRLKALRDN